MLSVTIVFATRAGIVELSCRESHIAEQAARIVRLARNTFLVRNRVIGRGNQVLRRALNAEYRKKTKRNVQTIAVIGIANILYAAQLTNVVRDIVAGAAGIAARAVAGIWLDNQRAEHHRLNRFDNGGRRIGRMVRSTPGRATVGIGIAAEDVHVTLSTVQNDLFIQHSDAAEFLRSAAAYADFKANLDIEAGRYLIEASVKLDRINRDVGPKDFGTYNVHSRTASVEQLLTATAEINARVLVAISVAARIEHVTCVDANGFSSAAGGAARVTGASVVLRHWCYSP